MDMNPEFMSHGLIISRKYWLESIKEPLETEVETESGLLSRQSLDFDSRPVLAEVIPRVGPTTTTLQSYR